MPAPKNLGDHIGEQMPLNAASFLRNAKPRVVAVIPKLLHRNGSSILPNGGVWVFEVRFL
jgi:hypothetical protein